MTNGGSLRNSCGANRSLLLIMPCYYGYETAIREEVEKLFEVVHVIYENVDFLHKTWGIAQKRMPSLYRLLCNRYYAKRIGEVDDNIDVVLIIRGASIGPSVLATMKSRFPKARFILYEWDGLNNLPNARLLASSSDAVFTFDPRDAKSEGWHYLPLFYTSSTEPYESRDIDVAFIGGFHSERARILERLIELCKADRIRLFDYLFTNRTRMGVWLKKNVTQRDQYSFLKRGGKLRFKPLALAEVNAIYGRTRVVVDYAHPGQSGLTMRTIECLGNSCKLVTNNKTVQEADFYDKRNIHVYDGVDVDVPEDFLSEPYYSVPDEIRSQYHISNWIRCILGELESSQIAESTK